MRSTYLGATLMALAVVGLWTAPASADVLYGVERVSGDVIRMDVDQNALTFNVAILGNTQDIYDPVTSGVPLEQSLISSNGFAYDAVHHRLYYGVPQDPSDGMSPSTLYYHALDGSDTDAGTNVLAGPISGNSADGAFYNGSYYYIANGTDDLYQVPLDPVAGVVNGAEIVIANISGAADLAMGFGDIDITDGGFLYGTANTRTGYKYIFFTLDLNDANPPDTYAEILKDTDKTRPQFALGCEGRLWANDTPDGQFYSVSDNGQLTPVFVGPLLNDLASGECDMPCENITVVPLCAGQDLPVGTVTVANDDAQVCVTYEVLGDWYIEATHLSIHTDASAFPQTKSGNPKVGKFEYGDCFETPVQVVQYCFTFEDLGIGLDTAIVIAAHAAVVRMEAGEVVSGETAWGDGCEGTGFPGKSWATYFTHLVQCGYVEQ